MHTLAKLTRVPASFSKTSIPNRDKECAIVGTTRSFQREASERIARLTSRQTEILDLMLAGYASKKIAFMLRISQRTVDNHRAAIARLTGAASLPKLVHVANCARCSLPTGSPNSTMVTDMKEVQHRFKNIVAVIQSIQRQTMRQCTTIADFDERFSARLSSFCTSLDGLIANDWRGMNVFDSIQAQLATFGIQQTDQIWLAGPDLDLTAEAVHNIGLAMHELVTNALKYGSLSAPQGHIELTWHLAVVDGQDRFLMSWTEFGGPSVTPPTRRGFGRQILERLAAIALAGKATYEFPSTGVKWTIDAPASNCCRMTESPAPITTRIPNIIALPTLPR